MHVSSSTLSFQSAHSAVDVRTVTQRVEIIPPRVSSTESVSQASSTSIPGRCSCYEDSESGLSPALSFVRGLLERMFGVRMEIADLSHVSDVDPIELQDPGRAAAPAQQASRGGAIVEYHETHTEQENLAFTAKGQIHLQDGRNFDVELAFTAEHEYTERFDLVVRIGDAARVKDPLVVNLTGTRVDLAANRVRFDLDADGKVEEIAQLAAGNHFLAIDRNDNGKIDDGRELFGPSSGNGFAALAALDSDNNGWLDASDAAWKHLRLWRAAESALTLDELGIGALGLAHSSTPFQLKDSQNNLSGQLRSSGVYLTDNGGAGFLQQIDLTA